MPLITTTKQLKTTTDKLAKADFITVDSEFIRESTYFPQLCLIQLASPDEAFLVDPLAEGLDLEPFFALMRNEKVLKIFHSARQDIEIIYHLGQRTIPTPLFDSQIAAQVLGFGESVAYDQLVSHICGVTIDKSSRFTDWRLRPLSEKQRSYALADVTYLRDVYLYLANELQKTGRTDWLKEEMEALSAPQTYQNPPEEAWRRIKTRRLGPYEMAILRQLAAWRERQADSRNLPRRRILRDETLLEIAQQQPTSLEALARLRSLPKGAEMQEFSLDLIDAVKTGLASKPEDAPTPKNNNKRLTDAQMSGVDILKLLLKIMAQKHGVAAKMLASNEDLEKIVLHSKDAAVKAMQGWRYQLYGQHALSILEGELAIGFKQGMIDLFKPDYSEHDTENRQG